MTIRTFTPNPAIDRTLTVDSLHFDVPLRPTARLDLPGGKGINVARAVGHLGRIARCHGVVAGYPGAWFVERLDEEGIDHRFSVETSAAWQTRTTTVVADDEHALLVYDRGDPVPEESLLAAVERCLADLEPGAVIVFCGSLPEGNHEVAVRRLLCGVRDRGAISIIDSSGSGLRYALSCGVDIIKVDHTEAAEVTGCTDPAASAVALLEGCERAVVTAGASGAIAASRDGERLRVPPAEVDARYPAGSGDAFAAALALGAAEGPGRWLQTLRAAAAAGAANTLQAGAGALDRDVYDALLKRIPAPTTFTTA